MPAFIKTQTRDEVHAQCDPACPEVVTFLQALLDKTPYAPVGLRIGAFETLHLRQCERCERFSRMFAEWLDRGRQERNEHRIAEQRELLQRLNAAD